MKYILSLSLLAFATAFQPAQTMFHIGQQNKDCIAKYAPLVTVGTATLLGIALGVLIAGYQKPYLALNGGDIISTTLQRQLPAIGLGSLSALLAYLSTSSCINQDSNTKSSQDNRPSLKNIYKATLEDIDSLSTVIIPTLKIASTGVAAFLALSAATGFAYHGIMGYKHLSSYRII